MDAVVPVVMSVLTVVVLIQVMFVKPRVAQDRCIRNTDVQRPGA